MTEKFLPLILVSAADLASASKLISEIIDNEVTDSTAALRGGRVWRLVNKYYRADVELFAAPDGAPAPRAAEPLDAHIVYVTEGGAAEAPAAEARRARAADAVVRLVAVDGARASDALAGWARQRCYELVPLAERAEEPHTPTGLQRLRDALHAHRWRGLQRLDRPDGYLGEADEPSDDDDEEEAAVERAEQFAEALGALAEASDASELSDAERRRRAERLVSAFCRALGAELPGL